jgi:hypothetical protein
MSQDKKFLSLFLRFLCVGANKERADDAPENPYLIIHSKTEVCGTILAN